MDRVRMADIIYGVLVVGLVTRPSQLFERHRREEVQTQEQGCDVEVVEEVRIGMVDGPDNYTFTQIMDLAVGSEGSIYVADAHPPSVLQFDRRGRFVRRIGREGAGPGEYRSILGLSMLRGGDLALWDNGNRRISVYDSAGAYLRSMRVAGGAYGPKPFQTDTVGRFYVKVRTPQSQILRGGLIGGGAYAYVRISSEGSVLDTVTTPAENPAGSFALATENGILHPFTLQEVYALSPFGFLVVGSNERYSFTIRDPQSPVMVERQDFTPVIVKEEERREWEALAQYQQRRSGLSFPPIPKKKPAFRDLWVDADGRVWVHRYVEAVRRDLPQQQRTRSGNLRPNVTWREASVFDVYTSEGEFLWCIRLPWRARKGASRGSLVWGIVRGRGDEEYVVRWRIPYREDVSLERER